MNKLDLIYLQDTNLDFTEGSEDMEIINHLEDMGCTVSY